MEGNADADRLVVLGQHLPSQQRRHERGDALLAVDQDALARRRGAVLELHRGVAPGDQVADRIALVERVQQVADLGGLPDEGPLDLGDGDLADLTQVSRVSIGCGVTE